MNTRLIRRTTTSAIAAMLIGITLSAPANSGTLYRWTDEQGQRHMETIIPADQAKLGYEVLNDQNFRVIERVHRALTAEELAVAVAAQQAEVEAKLLQQEAARRDRTLLATYMGVDDMQMTRNGQLRTLDSLIESTQRSLERLTTKLESLIASAASYERDGRAIPKNTEKNIENVRREMARQTRLIEENRDKQLQITDQFDTDINRFKTLKGIIDPVEPATSAVIAKPGQSAIAAVQ